MHLSSAEAMRPRRVRTARTHKRKRARAGVPHTSRRSLPSRLSCMRSRDAWMTLTHSSRSSFESA